jgi:uncharacterized protein (DUF2141 family)
MVRVIAPISAGRASCTFTGVPAGNYAIAFFHAEHNGSQLTPGLFGKPTQGYGFPTTPRAVSVRRTSMLPRSATTAAIWRYRVR